MSDKHRLQDAKSVSGAKSAEPRFSGTVTTRIRKLRRWKSVLDAVASLTPRQPHLASKPPERIGVLLQWGIGDAVLALPLLNGLARGYPGASVELIGERWLADLFAEEPWLGATHELVPPWTRPARKYQIWDRSWRRFAVQLFALRKVRFDLLVGVRFDPRETAQLRLLTARRTAGVSNAGGRAWLTDRIGLTAEDYYLRPRPEYNALALSELTGLEESSLPRLAVSEAARTAALARIGAAGYAGGPVVCVHNGAGNAIREWGAGRFGEVVASVRDLLNFVVVIDDGSGPNGPKVEVPAGIRSMIWKSGLRELKALLSVTDVLLCCDNGVMHMGAACGCRVVAIFGPGSPEIFAPREARHQMVSVDPMPCRPCFDNCIYPRPICMDGITVTQVSGALRRAIETDWNRSHFLSITAQV